MTHPSETLVLDANCLLNLYATGRIRDIAVALPYRLAVVEYVLGQEVLYNWRVGPTGIREEPEPVELSSLVGEGLLQVMKIETVDEDFTFSELADLTDGGEAISGAIAVHRQCALATDDRKARHALAERTPSVPLLTTMDLLKMWADGSDVPDSELRLAMEKIRLGANYVPGPRDPLYPWWESIMRGNSA